MEDTGRGEHMRRAAMLLFIIISFAFLFGTEAPGYVAITSSDGVNVFVDGVHKGTVVGSQLIISLSPGTYTLTAQKEGYEDRSVVVTVQSGRSTSISIELTQSKVGQERIPTEEKKVVLGQKTGTINIYSIPFPGARVTINGVNYGETDIRLTNFPTGQLTIEVESGGKSLQRIFTLDENETIDLQANFVDGKMHQLFTVRFDFPDGVEVSIDGNIIKKSEPVVLIGADHHVEMRATDLSLYESFSEKHITVTTNKTFELSPAFSKEYLDYIAALHPGELVLVEKGGFVMGDTWGDGSSHQKPAHAVELTYYFLIGKYEVTFEQYDWFCEATGRSKPKDEDWGRGNRPVINVSWWDAIAYCNWLSEREGLPVAYRLKDEPDEGQMLDASGNATTDITQVVGYRLPTEAEWEYAARGGNKSEGYKYAGSDTVGNVAWYWDNSDRKTQEVGKKTPNELGIYDMSGNVREWCSDWHSPYMDFLQIDPYIHKPTSSGPYRVIRGGSWLNTPSFSRVSARFSILPTGAFFSLGFRITRTVAPRNEPPVVNEVSGSSGTINRNSSVFGWSGSDSDGQIVKYEYRMDGGDWLNNEMNTSHTWIGYSEGTHTFEVRALDNAGDYSETLGWSFTYSSIVANMIRIEGGSFIMGDTWGDGSIDEKPTHKVTFTYDFYMGKYEVTFDEYDAFYEDTGRSKPDDNGWGRGSRPAINVSWFDAIAYCNWLSEKNGLSKAYDSDGNFLDKDGRVTTDPSEVIGYRLPTEAEWEYAARGGIKSEGYKYAGSDNADEVAWYTSNSDKKTQEVGKKAPNELGLYDMSGNVWEWCSDWYDSGYYSKSPTTNPYNSAAASHRALRGGGLTSISAGTRVANRSLNTPTFAYYYIGFRICRTVF